MKENKFIKFITSKYLILTVQILATALFTYFIFELDLVPLKYSTPVSVGLGLLIIIFFFIMLSGQKKQKEGKRSKRSIITKVISLLISILLMVGTTYVIRGDAFFDNVSEAKTQKYLISVITMKDSEATKLSQLDGKNFGVSYQHDTTTIAKAISDMEEEIGEQELTKYEDYSGLADALYNGEVDAIIVGQEYKSMLEANHEGFDDQTRIIKSYEYDAKLSVTTKQTDVTEKPFTIYVTGIDTYGSVNTVARSDVNLIVTVNPKSKQILMTSIPRDCEIKLNRNGKMDKLTHTGIYGTSETISTIENFLDVEINYFARTNFSGMTNIVDALGGITIESEYKNFRTLHGNYLIEKGINEMNGDKTLCFVRERYSLPNGDFDRGRNQQKVLKAMLDKAMSPKIITNFNNILSAVEGSFETDMSSKEIKSLLNMQLNDMADWSVYNVQVQGDGYKTTKTASMWGTEVYVMKPYDKQLKKIKKLIDTVEQGGTISDDDIEGLGN